MKVLLAGLSIAILQIADLVTTKVGMDMGASEANPLIAPLMHDWVLLTMIKVAIIGIFFSFLDAYRDNIAAFWGLIFGHNIVMIGIVANNFRIIASL